MRFENEKIGNIRVKERGDLDRRVLTGFRRRDLESLFLFSLLFSLKKRLDERLQRDV